MTKIAISPLLPAINLFACIVIVLLVLISPAPFSASSISLLDISPVYLNTSKLAANDTIVFGASSTTALNITSTPSTSISSTSSIELTSTAPPPMVTVPPVTVTALAAPSPTPTPGAPQVVTVYQGGTVTSPAPAVAPAAAPVGVAVAAAQRRSFHAAALRKREDFQNARGLYGGATNGTTVRRSGKTSKLELTFGPLGSCFRSISGRRSCTAARLAPSYDSSQLTDELNGGFIIDKLPTKMPNIPAFILATLIVLIIALALAVPVVLVAVQPARFGFLLEAGPRERQLRSAQGLACWTLIVMWVLLVASGISMRITFANARTAFNAANERIVLPLEATEDGATPDITLEASVGNAFGLIWACLGILGATIFLERRRLKRAAAVAEARSDVEAQWGRNVFEATRALTEGAQQKASDAKNAVMELKNVPARSKADEAGAPAAAAPAPAPINHYWLAPGQGLPPSHGAPPPWATTGYSEIKRCESPSAWDRDVKQPPPQEPSAWDVKRAPSPAPSAYDHHVASCASSEASLSLHGHAPSASLSSLRGPSPAPTYFTTGSAADDGEYVAKKREEAREHRARLEAELREREERIEELRERERWEMARLRKGGMGYRTNTD